TEVPLRLHDRPPCLDAWQSAPWRRRRYPALRAATEAATTQRISYIIVAPTSAVIPLGSKGGATSTTSPPTRLRPASRRTIICASTVVMPPHSGVPVPGA